AIGGDRRWPQVIGVPRPFHEHVDTASHLLAILRSCRNLVIGRNGRCAIGLCRHLTEEPDANSQCNIQKIEMHDRQPRSPDKTPGTSLGRFTEEKNSTYRLLLL